VDEFDLIKTYFVPLARDFPGSLNLTDDAAILDVPPGRELVVTTDAITEGIHFTGQEDAALIARKLLRVNLSDLAAMGATPVAYFLALMLPKFTNAAWIKNFAEGLQEDQRQFGIHLAGGDTTSTKGTLSFSITAIGSVAKGQALKRSTAKDGDDIYVSGVLGDAALGLACIEKKITHPAQVFLEDRYYIPQPRIRLGERLHSIATAAMDVSDGILQDMGHICEASGLGATLECDHLPLSHAAAGLQNIPDFWHYVATGGDDYELLFTAPVSQAMDIQRLAAELKLPLNNIGKMHSGHQVQLLDKSGKPMQFVKKGFRHFG
jgi:thiamine-monophosphate kinase